jgi:hypothetical protein
MTPGNQTNQATPTPRNQIHFARGEVHVFVKHRPHTSAGEIIKGIQDSKVLTDPFDKPGKPNDPQGPGQGNSQVPIYYSTDRVWTFDPSVFEAGQNDPNAYSLVFVSIPALDNEQKLSKYLGQVKIPDAPTINGVKIEQVTPNWLSAGSPQADGSGGPGGKPVAPGTAVDIAAATATREFPPDLEITTPLDQRGACTEVFILDTAPCDVDLKRAYQKWVVEAPSRSEPEHLILKRLLDPTSGALRDASGNLRIEYAGHSHLLEVVDAYLPDHDYVMADHGLFVAGIINTFAPAARLHMIEVLNPYGMGTLETIVSGFARVAKFASANPSTKVVVNASLFLAVSQKDEVSRKVLIEKDPFWKDIDEKLYNGEFAPLLSVCAFIDQYAAHIVAASGNDGTKIRDEATGKDKNVHPSARYPAAYKPVLGVAALDADNKFALYSNEPDVPETDGAAVFGGSQTNGVTDPNLGMIGAYIGSYPDGVPNTQGLASWSGTSFATPVISAALAILLCEDPKCAIARIKAYFTNHAAEGDGNASAPAGPGSSSAHTA